MPFEQFQQDDLERNKVFTKDHLKFYAGLKKLGFSEYDIYQMLSDKRNFEKNYTNLTDFFIPNAEGVNKCDTFLNANHFNFEDIKKILKLENWYDRLLKLIKLNKGLCEKSLPPLFVEHFTKPKIMQFFLNKNAHVASYVLFAQILPNFQFLLDFGFKPETLAEILALPNGHLHLPTLINILRQPAVKQYFENDVKRKEILFHHYNAKNCEHALHLTKFEKGLEDIILAYQNDPQNYNLTNDDFEKFCGVFSFDKFNLNRINVSLSQNIKNLKDFLQSVYVGRELNKRPSDEPTPEGKMPKKDITVPPPQAVAAAAPIAPDVSTGVADPRASTAQAFLMADSPLSASNDQDFLAAASAPAATATQTIPAAASASQTSIAKPSKSKPAKSRHAIVSDRDLGMGAFAPPMTYPQPPQMTPFGTMFADPMTLMNTQFPPRPPMAFAQIFYPQEQLFSPRPPMAFAQTFYPQEQFFPPRPPMAFAQTFYPQEQLFPPRPPHAQGYYLPPPSPIPTMYPYGFQYEQTSMPSISNPSAQGSNLHQAPSITQSSPTSTGLGLFSESRTTRDSEMSTMRVCLTSNLTIQNRYVEILKNEIAKTPSMADVFQPWLDQATRQIEILKQVEEKIQQIDDMKDVLQPLDEYNQEIDKQMKTPLSVPCITSIRNFYKNITKLTELITQIKSAQPSTDPKPSQP